MLTNGKHPSSRVAREAHVGRADDGYCSAPVRPLRDAAYRADTRSAPTTGWDHSVAALPLDDNQKGHSAGRAVVGDVAEDVGAGDDPDQLAGALNEHRR